MNKIVDQYGIPFDKGLLKEVQTSRVASLQNEYLTGMLDGLTPARLANTLRAADNGDLFAQHRLFSDMEERDAHIAAEMGKRKLAPLSLDWTIVPPRNASAAEKAHTEWLLEVLTDAVDPIEDLMIALMDGVGHGFAPVELEWRSEGSEWLPAYFPRPQEWFQLDQARRNIRLRDMSVDGAPLAPFGWVFHTHGKAKTGYQGRLGLHRTLSWSFLYKSYAIGDFAELLETFGLPIITGKYYAGANDEEKASLLRAVVALGHDARAIMPADMQIEIEKVTAGGDSSGHLSLVDWCERSQSKVILGQTMSAESKSSGIGSGNADLHREVRRDILVADVREIAGTITRDLLYPLIALNRGNIDGLRRCPRLVFDTGEPEDIKLLAESLPPLVNIGMQIPTDWAHDKLKIPVPTDGQAVLTPQKTQPTPPTPPASLAAMAAAGGAASPAAELSDQLSASATPTVEDLLTALSRIVQEAPDLATLQRTLLEAYGHLDTADLTRHMAAAFALAELRGMADVRDEAGQ
ncbi:DUF935 domain-containing protein [Propionivibrio dicarboxylicus]|uniref:Mu-like prophage protein gp29 n=1 Tax=Propionivibrio dicarboxylicus TaxID=83767 RepID=A0A1G8LCF8_9RHOO|nr:DUF935 domain-containing protein [Propionivibrio dicarboxylicus]SDI53418.1 Mu-like prophage protein gp29 [Propionivibrio dicarboxylicus]